MDTGVFTRERLLTVILAILTLLTLYVCYLIIEPFIPAMAFALALAVSTTHPYEWLRTRVRRNTAAAAIATILVAVLIVGPAAFLLVYIVQMTADNIAELQRGGGLAHVREVFEQQPFVGRLLAEFGGRFRLEEQLGALAKAAASRASGIVSGSIGVLTQFGITLFVLFFLYRDTDTAKRAGRALLPLSAEEADRLFERVGNTIQATVTGSITVAAIQALLAGTVYVMIGVPAAVLWGSVTFLTALIPVLGTFIVWAPIALYLALTGSIAKAVFLAIWGGAVVSSVDNLLYPHLVGDKLRLHTVPTFFSVIGGLGLFGPAGLILGPMALAVAMAILDVWWERTEHGQGAEKPIPIPPPDAPAQTTRDE